MIDSDIKAQGGSRLRISLLALSALLLGGCATPTPAKSSAMIAVPTAAITTRPESLGLNVTGGSEPPFTRHAPISNSGFTEALRESIVRSGLFAKVVPAGQPDDFHLEVVIVRLEQPLIGISMTVTLETNWSLTRRLDHAIVWQKTITSAYTAAPSEAFVGVNRLRLATEGAARANIQDAIGQMGALTQWPETTGR